MAAGTLRLGQATVTYDAEAEPCEELPWEHITGESMVSLGPCSVPYFNRKALDRHRDSLLCHASLIQLGQCAKSPFVHCTVQGRVS